LDQEGARLTFLEQAASPAVLLLKMNFFGSNAKNNHMASHSINTFSAVKTEFIMIGER
jgi:hypothetical protein